jgi:hypothetical protein
VLVNCAVVPATAEDVELVTVQLFPLAGVPMPKPSAPEVGGVTEVSVTLTLPAVVTVNVKTAELFCATGPL